MDIRTRRKIYPGGFSDNLALSGVTASMLLANPAMGLGAAGAAVGLGLAAAGGAWAANRVATAGYRSVFSQSSVRINSDEVPKVASHEGITLGYTVDGGEPLVIPWDDWMRHCLVVGQSGVGKTVFGEWVLFQQIINGGGLLWIDGKLDPDNLRKLDAMCAWAGRRADLLVINPGDPNLSNTYNPILFGDPDEVASRVLSLIPSSENNPGTDFYRQAANQGMVTLVGAIQKAGFAYNFTDLSILLQNQKALASLEMMTPGASDESKALRLFLDQYKVADRNGNVSIDLKRLKETFGGIGGRLHTFGSGNFGQITGTYSPDINLYEAMRSNKIIYVMLPTMGKKEAASNFGKMNLGDLRSAIAEVQSLPKKDRPWPPFLNFADEFGSYVTQSTDRPFEQGRSAHVTMMPAFQTIANLDAVSQELREMVLGNTWTKVFFKVGTDDTAEKIVSLIGKERRVALSVSISDGKSVRHDASGSTRKDASGSDSFGVSERTEETEKVSSDMLKKLGKGEAIVTYGGSKVYHIKIPALEFDKKFIEEIGPFCINKKRATYQKGLDFFRNVDGLLSS
jgi:intracellular multiplication protein IcmO